MKRIVSFVMGLMMLIALSAPIFAATIPENADFKTITQFAYVVYDKNGAVRETGITPNFNTRYSWSGITLANGESARFLQANGRAFTILEGTAAYFSVLLDHSANMYNVLYKGTYDGRDGISYFSSVKNGMVGYGLPINIEDAGYFWPWIMNTSSDSVTIKTCEFNF